MIILHYLDITNIVDGNLLSVLDISLFCKHFNISSECFLLLPSYHSNQRNKINSLIQNLISSRYKDIIPYKILDENNLKYSLIRNKNTIFCSDRTLFEIKKLKISYIVSNNKIIMYRTWFSFYNQINQDNIIILNENPECGIVNYKRKIYFNSIINYHNEDKAFILANGERRLFNTDIEYLSKYSNKFREIIICSNHKLDLVYPFIYKNTISDRLFDFSTFIYYGSNNYDYAPRMLLECIYLDKSIIIEKLPLNKSHRFKVLENKDLLMDYNLTLDDEIFRYI